ncbi:hypothetical protein [Campylobacter felis]|uniref:hypothetical protein n=2 Tax=Campylobacter felis TaxID=2974565 RepID=UPI0025A9A221
MLMRGNASIETLNINGTLVGYSNYGGINFRDRNGKINTITVNQGGIIHNGVRNNNNGTIQTLTINNGTINGGITNNRTNGTVNGNIVNSGTNASTGNISIKGTSNVSGSIVNQNGATFNNQITLDQNSKLGGITNNSTMSGTLNLNGNAGTFNSTLTLNNKVRTISNAGTFNSQLNLSNKVGTIENKQGGTISNDITINNGGSVGAINNEGTMQNITNNNGTLSHITNSGTMKVITTKDGSLNNQGTIENLKITSGDFKLNNTGQGKIAGIEIGGNGNIKINDNMNIGYSDGVSTFKIANNAAPTLNFGVVRTAITAQETYPTVKLVNANNASQTQAKVAIDKLIISLVGEDTQIGKSVSLANSVSGAANGGLGNIYIKSADFSQKLKESGFYGKFNLYTQTVDTRFNSNLGAAGLFSQVFINQLGRRSLLFDSFLNEASRASLRYKRTQPDTNFDIFVRPYYSKIKTDLTDIPEKADGTSSGILAGGHTYFDNSLLMLYGAVEKNKTNLADDVFNFNNDTFLLGSKYSIELAQSHIGQLFGGVDIRGSYTKADLEREPVSGFKSQGDTKNYAYDARVFLASIIYYDLQDHSKYLTPQIGIGHVGAKLKGFNMKGDRLAYKESLDDMTYGITYATASLNWFKRKDNVAIQLDGGVRVNLNNEINTQTRINNQNFTNHFEASKYYSQLGGAFMWINPYGIDISLGYKFLFGESATSHTANLRLHKTF